MDKLVFDSYAKLNLYLLVLNKRKDGFHNIRTVFERIDLCDKITLRPRQDKRINIICSSPDVPKDESNLAYRSARLLQDACNNSLGVDIAITKHIPVGSGLGGGSSNAANTLIGLNELWGLKLSRERLAFLAQKVGSDAPFFIYDSPFAYAYGRGDRIVPLRQLNRVRIWHVLVVPRIKVSTPIIYRKWDQNPKPVITSMDSMRSSAISKKAKLTREGYDVKILSSALKKNDLSLLGRSLLNNLEQVTAREYPEVRRIKERLIQLGVKAVLMSGSGPAVFGIVYSGKEAASICRQLREGSGSWRIFVTQTF